MSDIIASKVVKAGRRLYYIDLKKDKLGGTYLSITEHNKADTEKSGRRNIFVYEDDFKKFLKALLSIFANLSETEDILTDLLNTNESIEDSDSLSTDFDIDINAFLTK